MTPDDRAARLALALADALRNGAAISHELADQLRALLPRRKRGGQVGAKRAKRAGSVQARGEEIASVYAFERALGASEADALITVRERLNLDAVDSTLHAAMQPHLPTERDSVAALIAGFEALRASAETTERDYAAAMADAHARANGLPDEAQRRLYAALTAWRAHTRAAEAHALSRTADTTRARADARDAAERAFAALGAALQQISG